MTDTSKLSLDEICAMRDKAVRLLDKSLSHKPRLQLIAIITSFLSLKELEELAKFQDRDY